MKKQKKTVIKTAIKIKKGAIGLDIVDASRFVGLQKKSASHQLKKLFFDTEIAYCSKFKDSSIHFAGLFAAKEAASKALGVAAFPFIELEIRHDTEGAPQVFHFNKKLPVSVSISHTKTIAAAVAMS